MECEHIRELILTDYPDGEMDEERTKQLENHLASCLRCKEFSIAAGRSVIEPFAAAGRRAPPDAVWSRIRDEIAAEKQKERSFLAVLRERARSFISIPESSWALGTAMATALMIVAVTVQLKLNYRGADTLNAREQIEYLASLADAPRDVSIHGGQGFGTVIEEYFL